MSNAPLPPVAFMIKHKVSNFETWKKGFDAGQGARQAAGILGHHLHRSAEDPNLVAIYLPAAARGPVEALVASPALKEAMKAGGVISEPEIMEVKPIENQIVSDRGTAGLIVTAEVEDYAAWKKGYDGGTALRASHGIIGHAVNQLAGHPNTIVVYHQGESVQALRDFVSSPEVKAAMKGSGVKVPKMEFYQGVGAFTAY